MPLLPRSWLDVSESCIRTCFFGILRAILRAKCRWNNEGEKHAKYFLNLEKRHFKNCVISQLKTGENEFVTSDKEILHQCENFYRDLYKSRISEQQSEPSNFNFFEDKYFNCR